MKSAPSEILQSPGRKREQILKELRKQLAIKGVQGLTMRGLAESSQVATRTLFNLFGSKDGLIAESLKDMANDVHTIVSARRKTDTNPLNELLDYIEVVSELIRSEPGYSNAMIYAYYSADASLSNFHRDFHDFKKDMFAQCLLKMSRPQELQKWVSIELLSRRLTESHIAIYAEWTNGMLSDDELVDTSLFGTLSILVGHVGPAYEKAISTKLAKLGRALNQKMLANDIANTPASSNDKVVDPVRKSRMKR